MHNAKREVENISQFAAKAIVTSMFALEDLKSKELSSIR